MLLSKDEITSSINLIIFVSFREDQPLGNLSGYHLDQITQQPDKLFAQPTADCVDFPSGTPISSTHT